MTRTNWMVLLFMIASPLISTGQADHISKQPKPLSTLTHKLSITYSDSLFASHSMVHIAAIHFEGNRLTRDRILYRELLFSEGDSIPTDRLIRRIESSRLNLMNTTLFNFVEPQVSFDQYPDVEITYHFVERWNIWPVPVFELDEPNLNLWLEDPSFSKFNYGIRLVATNVTGRNERIQFQAKTGNVQSLALLVYTPYINKAQTIGWGFRYGINRSKKRAYATEDNDRLFIRLSDHFIANEYYVSTHTNIRPKLYNNHRFSIGYHSYNFADTLLTLNPRFGPDGKNRFSYITASYSFRRDLRDIIAYPLKGFFYEVGVSRKGFGLFGDTDMDITTFEATAQHYIPLISRWFLAYGASAKFSEGTTLSYFDQQGIGYIQSLVRGYENYVIDGHQFMVFKSNLKYNILPQRVTEIGFIPSEKFSLIHYAVYANLFVDAGYMRDRHFYENNPLSNTWLGSIGLGLDLVTYYDTIFRAEFSFNRHGKLGVFFHTVAPI